MDGLTLRTYEILHPNPPTKPEPTKQNMNIKGMVILTPEGARDCQKSLEDRVLYLEEKLSRLRFERDSLTDTIKLLKAALNDPELEKDVQCAVLS